MFREDEWPELGELVMATVSRITSYGAYVTLDEYGKDGFLHISEISSSWIRNIRDFIREGEKVVLKVLRVDPERNHIDLSLRRVTQREKREKTLLWKRSRKVESLLRSASKRLRMPLSEVYEKAASPLEKSFGDPYEGLESAAREGVEVLLEQGIPKDLAEVLTEIAKERIRISKVKVKRTINMRCTKPRGVLKIKEALMKAKGINVPHGVGVRIYTVSPPRYRIEVTAHDYKEANTILEKVAETALRTIVKAGGRGTLEGD